MRKLLFLFTAVCLVYSCDPCGNCPDDCPDDCLPEPLPIQMGCGLDLTVINCHSITCQSTSPIANLNVEFFNSREEAIEGINGFASRFTDAEGKISYSSVLPCGLLYIKLDLGEQGTYIDVLSVSDAASINREEIRIVESYLYDDSSEGMIPQTHINYSNPLLFQESFYVRFQIDNHISFDIPEYTDNTLRVKLVEQLSENSFKVEESIDRLEGILGSPFYPEIETVNNVWTFYEDSLRVSPYKDEYFTSFVWNLSEFFLNTESEGYTFSLNRPETPVYNLSEDFVQEVTVFPTGAVEDYTIGSNVYTDLILDHRSYVGFDGPKKIVVYNKEHGIIRSMDFFAGMAQITHGFELVLD